MIVSLENTTASPMYFNLWVDWDRDGDWGGEAAGPCADGSDAPEWAVQNQVINLTTPGQYRLQTPAFKARPMSSGPLWVRATLSDSPAPADDGRGPSEGYLLGETEDYLHYQDLYSTHLPVLQRSGEPPPPEPQPEGQEDPLEAAIKITLPQVPAGQPASLPRDGLQFRLDNTSDNDRLVELRLLVIINGEEYRTAQGPYTIEASQHITDVIVYPSSTPAARFPAQFILTADELTASPGGGAQTGTDGYYFLHDDETAPDNLVLYDELALQAQTEALTFHNAPGMSGRLLTAFDLVDTSNVLGVALYAASDADLVEPPIEPDPVGLLAAPEDDSFILCPEWYVNLLDNTFGEDYGTVDDGWRARGATVAVYLDGTVTFLGNLDSFGCLTLAAPSGPADILIYFFGTALLQTDGNNTLTLQHYDAQASTSPKAALIGVLNAQPNVVYRPEVPAWDGFGVLSYLIQERYNAGADGILRVYSDDCPTVGTQNCSSSVNGVHALFLRPVGQNGWRRKFLAGHEWGHKLLSMTTSGTTNDCRFQEPGVSTSHGLKTSEYSSCAAMEGWAHYIAAEAWNNPLEGSNPGATFVYWSGTVYDVEIGPDLAWCLNGSWLSGFNLPSLCNYYGVELDWMRHWWDFRTNDTASSPRFQPSHNYLKTIIDLTVFAGGEYDLSGAIQAALSDPEMRQRWSSYGCFNGIQTFNCP
jgi:hypothetical protein